MKKFYNLGGQLMRVWYLSQKCSHSLGDHVQLSWGITGLKFGLSLHLQPYLVCVSSEHSDKTLPCEHHANTPLLLSHTMSGSRRKLDLNFGPLVL